MYEGALVPISPGAMRNQWFPGRYAEYVTAPELKRLRLSNITMTRDFQFGQPTPVNERVPDDANAIWQRDIPSDIKVMSTSELRTASDLERANIEAGMTDAVPKKIVEVEKLTPERSMELVELFVPQRLEFYRQPIVEEKPPEEPVKPLPTMPQYEGVGGDLLAARSRQSRKAREKPQGIYGSVSAHDVLVAMRAVMANNDEAARVILQESDIQLIDLLQAEGSEAGRLKHIGDFVVEIKMKGVEKPVSRTVRIIPQDAQ